MKRIIIVMVVAVLTMLTACSGTSCNIEDVQEETTVPQTGDMTGVAKLNAAICAYNDSVCTPYAATRSRFSRLFKAIVGDAVGALFGNLYGGPVGAGIGAAAFSAYACYNQNDYKDTPLSNEINKRFDTKLLVPHNTSLNSPMDSIGVIHNKLILDASKDINVSDTDSIVQKLKLAARKNYKNYDSVNYDIINKYLGRFKRAVSYPSKNDLEQNLENAFPEKKEDIVVISNFIKGLKSLNTGTNKTEYLQKILKLVDESKLENDQKQSIRNAIIVANASDYLWKEQ